MTENRYDSVDLLQRLPAEHPALLAGEQMIDGSPRRWALISCQVAIAGEDGSSPW